MLSNIMTSRFRICSYVGIVALLLCIATIAQGQERSEVQEGSGRESSQVFSAAFPRPLSKPQDARYPWLHYCKMQATRIADSVIWGQRADTIPWDPSDTLPAAVRARARQCMTRFDVEQVGRLFFETAVDVTLITGDDSLLVPLIDSAFVIQRESAASDSRWAPYPASDFFRKFLAAAPARMNLVQRMLAWDPLEGEPAGAIRESLLGTRVVMLSELYDFAKKTNDLQSMQKWRDSLVVWWPKLDSDPVRRKVEEMALLKMNRDIYAAQFGSDSLLALIPRMREVAEFLGEVIGSRDPRASERLFANTILAGMQAPSADAPFTFFHDGITQIPEPGRAMVVLRVGEQCERDCGAEIMRFKSLIGDIPMVMIAQVFGNVRRSNPGTGAENAEALRAHLQDSLGIKLSLVVDTAPRYITPAPDLKYLYGQSPLALNWADAGSSTVFVAGPKRVDVGGLVVINKHGRVVWERGFDNAQRDNKEFIVRGIKKIASE